MRDLFRPRYGLMYLSKSQSKKEELSQMQMIPTPKTKDCQRRTSQVFRLVLSIFSKGHTLGRDHQGLLTILELKKARVSTKPTAKLFPLEPESLISQNQPLY
jgi:hypothetical protein